MVSIKCPKGFNNKFPDFFLHVCVSATKVGKSHEFSYSKCSTIFLSKGQKTLG